MTTFFSCYHAKYVCTLLGCGEKGYGTCTYVKYARWDERQRACKMRIGKQTNNNASTLYKFSTIRMKEWERERKKTKQRVGSKNGIEK